MTRVLIFIIVVFVGIGWRVEARAQASSCSIRADQLPTMRGLSLGMSTDELVRIYPNFRAWVRQANVNGYFESDLNMPGYVQEALGPELSEGLGAIKLGFLDNKIVRIRFTYDGLTDWKDLTEFSEAIISKLKLPELARWKVDSAETRRLDCDGIFVVTRLKAKLSRYETQTQSVTFSLTGIDETLTQRERERKDRLSRSAANTGPIMVGPKDYILSLESRLILDDNRITPLANNSFYLLDGDLPTILREAGIRAPGLLSYGEDPDEALVYSFMDADRNKNSLSDGNRYLRNFYEEARAALKPHLVEMVTTNDQGKAQFKSLAAGLYYIVGAAPPPFSGTWNFKIRVELPYASLVLDLTNTISYLKRANAEEERKHQAQEEMKKKQRVFKP